MLKITEERERGIVMEISTTAVELFKLILLYFCIPYIEILCFYVLCDIIEYSCANFSNEFIEEVVNDLKEKQVQPSQNSFLYLLRSIIYSICFIMIFKTGYQSENQDQILYMILSISLVFSKLFKESYLKKIYKIFVVLNQTQQKTTSGEKNDV